MSPPSLQSLTLAAGIAGAALALGAALAKATSKLSPLWVNRLYLVAYLLMGASVALYVARGLLGSGQ